MMPVMGTAKGSTFEEALEPALALGVALQLTNILRDVGEDRVRQRIYLPQEDLRRFGVTEAALLKGCALAAMRACTVGPGLLPSRHCAASAAKLLARAMLAQAVP